MRRQLPSHHNRSDSSAPARVALLEQLSRQSCRRHCFDSQSKHWKSAAQTKPAVRSRFSVSPAISTRTFLLSVIATSTPPNPFVFQSKALSLPHGQFAHLPLHRHRDSSDGIITLLPWGAISSPFFPLKKRRSNGNLFWSSRH